jgi:hypothetical protein
MLKKLIINLERILKKYLKEVKNFTLNFATQHPYTYNIFIQMEQKIGSLLEILFIGVLLIGLIIFMLDSHTVNHWMILFLSFLSQTILFSSFALILIFTLKLIRNNLKNFSKTVIEDLRKEVISIFPLKIGTKSFFFLLICFLFSCVLMYFHCYKQIIPIVFLGIYFLLREIKSVEHLLNDSKTQDLEITKIFREKHSKFYFVSTVFNYFCFSYFVFFIIVHSVDFDYLSATDSVEEILAKIVRILEPLSLLMLLFLNSITLHFFLEFIVILSDADILLTTLLNVVRRISKAAARIFIGGGVTGTILCISPGVEFPGVNECQIMFGRGYGYRVPEDWVKGELLNSYLDASTVQGLAQKYGTDNILDANSFANIIEKEDKIVAHLKKNCTPYEQEILGVKYF